jgi:uncharacterized protein (DUF1330 family)
MAGYVIVQIQVTDADGYAEYKAGVGVTIDAFKGEFLVRGGEVEILEGEWSLPRTVILRFPSVEDAKAWYDSDMYKPHLEKRLKTSSANLVIVEGV